MNWKQIWTVFGKEIRDSLRDRRTLISMIAFPALIIPGMMFGFSLVAFKVVKKAEQEVPAVMIVGADNAPEVRRIFESGAKLRVVDTEGDYARQIADKKIRAAVEFPIDFTAALARGELATVKVLTYEGELKSSFAAGELDRVLREYRERIVAEKLAERDLGATFVKPFEIQRQNVAPPEKVGGNLFGGFVPYLLIFLVFMGAMYPAIDLTAGEKERGTMETILCSPVGRVELVLGKFLTVLTVSLATVVTSVISTSASALALVVLFQDKLTAAGKSGAAAGAQLPMISLPGLLAVLVMMIPIAILFSAVLFSTALYAKTHKEAQTYVSPLMVVIILPALAAMLPGVELNRAFSLVPILNVSLLSKEMVSGSFPWVHIGLTFGSSCVYAACALGLAVRMFNRESVLFRT